MATSAQSLVRRYYPEIEFGGFTRVSASVEFLFRVGALLKPTDHVLDYGAGRGAFIDSDTTAVGRNLKLFKGRVAHVEGCDVDMAVLENPYLDHAQVIDPAAPLPYADASFDLVVSNWVFEHVDDAGFVAAELLRVVKPGGFICAITPNKHGYIAWAARLAGNSRHVPLLKRIQPERKDFDVFPTRYHLNTRRDIRRHFAAAARMVILGTSSEPAYHFNNPALYRLLKTLHAWTPERLSTALMIFIQKAGSPAEGNEGATLH